MPNQESRWQMHLIILGLR